MPHVHIKHFPKDFTEEQHDQLAAAVTALILDHFDTHAGAVSIRLEPVAREEWRSKVVEPELTDQEHLLLKAPEYGTK